MTSDAGATAKPPGYFSVDRHEMLHFVPAATRALVDVGCGAGGFGAEAKQRLGCRAWGIELEPAAAAAASRVLDEVRQGDALEELARLPDAAFDCVVFNDILEHLVDPLRALEAAKPKLRRDGVVVASVPNVRYHKVLRGLLFEKQWRYGEKGVLDRTHLRFFTERSLRDAFADAGYEMLELRGINPTRNRSARWVASLSGGWLSDIVFLQFGCRARPSAGRGNTKRPGGAEAPA